MVEEERVYPSFLWTVFFGKGGGHVFIMRLKLSSCETPQR